MQKKIVGIQIISPGSNPDVDSDFNTKVRGETLSYVENLYGKGNISNIGTQSTLAAKGAFKAACTIFGVPFSQANKAASLIPPPVEGEDIALHEIFDPEHPRFHEGADFRNFVSGDTWKNILEAALGMEGRTKANGVHACVTGDALVTTGRGLVELKGVKEGDLVLTHKGRFRKVVKSSRTGEKNVFSVSAMGFPCVEATEDHPFFVGRMSPDGKISARWSEVKDLDPVRDYLAVPLPDRGIDLDGSPVLTTEGFWWLLGKAAADGGVSDDGKLVVVCRSSRKHGTGDVRAVRRVVSSVAQEVAKNDSGDTVAAAVVNNLVDVDSRGARSEVVVIDFDPVTKDFLLSLSDRDSGSIILKDSVLSLPDDFLASIMSGFRSSNGSLDHESCLSTVDTDDMETALTLSKIALALYGYPTSIKDSRFRSSYTQRGFLNDLASVAVFDVSGSRILSDKDDAVEDDYTERESKEFFSVGHVFDKSSDIDFRQETEYPERPGRRFVIGWKIPYVKWCDRSRRVRSEKTSDTRKPVRDDEGVLWVPLLSVKDLDTVKDVYNLTVEDDSSYVVNGLAVHNCGVIISAKPLDETIPLQVRQDDGRVVTQWSYQDCESLGLIKMDFLGLDTVDIIQNTLEYIKKSGKTPPNMLEIIHGDMDDPKVFELFQRGDTVGVFQFGSSMVRELLQQMLPTEFNDLVACTAIARPGPMGMGSHRHYSDRKNGREPSTPIHPDFEGSPLEDILANTYNLCVYQEQVTLIANRIAGMSLQEGDKLRKAMGKKKKDIMDVMRPKFIQGGMENGYSEKAMTTLWDVLEPFAKYAFNKSHSVAYAMTAYQSAYLKTYYPVEFMSALISQTVDNKDKTLNNVLEAKRMGITMGTVDINLSDARVSPDYTGKSGVEILYGLSGVKAVSPSAAQVIVDERRKNGAYTSVQDVITRCVNAGITNRRVFENLAAAGAFDALSPNRRSIVMSVPDLMKNAKKTSQESESLFSMFDENESVQVSLADVEDWPYDERLKEEADVVGMYLSGHPLDNVDGAHGEKGGVKTVSEVSIKDLVSQNKSCRATIIAAVSSIVTKKSRSGTGYILSLDDGTGFLQARPTSAVVNQIRKFEAIESVKRAYARRDTVSKDLRRLALAPTLSRRPFEMNKVYVFDVMFYSTDQGGRCKIERVRDVSFSKDGTLATRIICLSGPDKNKTRRALGAFVKKIEQRHPGDTSVFAGYIDRNAFRYGEDALTSYMLDVIDGNVTDPSGKNDEPSYETAYGAGEHHDEDGSLKTVFGEDSAPSRRGRKAKEDTKVSQRRVPSLLDVPERYRKSFPRRRYEMTGIVFEDTEAMVDMSSRVESVIENKVGYDRYDHGFVRLVRKEDGTTDREYLS